MLLICKELSVNWEEEFFFILLVFIFQNLEEDDSDDDIVKIIVQLKEVKIKLMKEVMLMFEDVIEYFIDENFIDMVNNFFRVLFKVQLIWLV